MLWSLNEDGSLRTKIQVFSNPECALFEQQVVGLSDESDDDSDDDIPLTNGKAVEGDNKPAPTIIVRYITPKKPLLPKHPAHDTPLTVPLRPDTTTLDPATIDMYRSSTKAYRMGDAYDAWFSACLGFPAALIYIGDGRRPQLGFLPLAPARKPKRSGAGLLLSFVDLVLGYISACLFYLLTFPLLFGYDEGGGKRRKDRVHENAQPPWITFADMAPFLVVSESSLADLSSRVGDSKPLEMHRFRPNIIIGSSSPSTDNHAISDDDLRPWDEDFWAELSVSGSPTLQLTGNCARCVSVNVDYETGRPTEGRRGAVLRTMAVTRRVDKGKKWESIFGRYASLVTVPRRGLLGWWEGGGREDPGKLRKIAVGDEVRVTRRNQERDVWDWPSLKG